MLVGECQGFVLFWEGEYLLLGIFLLMYFAVFKSSSLTDEVHRPMEKRNWFRWLLRIGLRNRFLLSYLVL